MEEQGILRKKCPVCKSCTTHYNHENTMYFACGFCRTLYKLVAQGALEKVTDIELIRKVEFRLL